MSKDSNLSEFERADLRLKAWSAVRHMGYDVKKKLGGKEYEDHRGMTWVELQHWANQLYLWAIEENTDADIDNDSGRLSSSPTKGSTEAERGAEISSS